MFSTENCLRHRAYKRNEVEILSIHQNYGLGLYNIIIFFMEGGGAFFLTS